MQVNPVKTLFCARLIFINGFSQGNCAGKQAEIAVDQIRTISKKRLRQNIDQLPATQASQLRRIITEMYGE